MRAALVLALVPALVPAAPLWAQGDDHGDDFDQATSIDVGAAAEGTIDVGGDEDWFRFPAEAGARYVLRTTLDGLNDSVLTLYDADGETQIEENDDSEGLASRITWRCPETGQYYLRVRAYGGDATGGYGLLVSPAPEISPDGGALTLGEPVEGELETPESTVRYPVDLEAGTTYRFETELGTLHDSGLRLFAPGAEEPIATNDDFPGTLASRIDWRCADAGAYAVEVFAVSGSAGTYTLTASTVEIEDAHGDTADRAATLGIDEIAEGQMDIGGDVDWFCFVAQAGVRYVARVARGTLGDSVATLYGADGESEVASNDDVMSGVLDSEIDWTCDRSGGYYLKVAAFRDGGTGTYAVQIHAAVDGEDAGAAVLLLPRGIESSVVDSGDDSDEFVFYAVPGDYSLIVRTETVDAVRVHFQDQNLTARRDEPLAYEWTATEEGQAAVAVEGVEGGVGRFMIAMTRAGDEPGPAQPEPEPEPEPQPEPEVAQDDDYPDAAEAAAPLPPGGLLRAQISRRGDRDFFALPCRAGTTYTFHVFLEGLDDSMVAVIGPDGTTELGEDDDGGVNRGSRLTWTCDEDGTYYVRVRAFSNGTGGYRLEVEQGTDDVGNTPETAGELVEGRAVDGAIEMGGDADLWRVDCEEGITYVFTVDIGTLQDSLLDLLGTDGQRRIQHNDDREGHLGSQIVWTCPETGTYYLRVTGYSTAKGTYRLTAGAES